jgi:primosomal replication protein N''
LFDDLRRLKARGPDATALAALLRIVKTDVSNPPCAPPREIDRFLSAESDPSQEAAVFAARHAPGLLLEGPPGTGKSQTIVNIIADAIGRKKSVLVICQKHAAIDVVRKRLEREGLQVLSW